MTSDQTTKVGQMDLAALTWHKSSHSNGGSDQTSCVEVASLPGLVAVRDSKDPSGPALTFDRPAWRAFLDTLRTGDL